MFLHRHGEWLKQIEKVTLYSDNGTKNLPIKSSKYYLILKIHEAILRYINLKCIFTLVEKHILQILSDVAVYRFSI